MSSNEELRREWEQIRQDQGMPSAQKVRWLLDKQMLGLPGTGAVVRDLLRVTEGLLLKFDDPDTRNDGDAH